MIYSRIIAYRLSYDYAHESRNKSKVKGTPNPLNEYINKNRRKIENKIITIIHHTPYINVNETWISRDYNHFQLKLIISITFLWYNIYKPHMTWIAYYFNNCTIRKRNHHHNIVYFIYRLCNFECRYLRQVTDRETFSDKSNEHKLFVIKMENWNFKTWKKN